MKGLVFKPITLPAFARMVRARLGLDDGEDTDDPDVDGLDESDDDLDDDSEEDDLDEDFELEIEDDD